MDVDDVEAGDRCQQNGGSGDPTMLLDHVHNSDNRRHFGNDQLSALQKKAASDSPEETAWLLNIFINDTQDELYKCEFLQYVPSIAVILSEEPNNHGRLKSLIESHLLPTVASSLVYSNITVTKAGETALLALLEHNLIRQEYILSDIWPILEESLSQPKANYGAGNAIKLMSKMAPWLGSETIGRLLIPVLKNMSTDSDATARNICASHFGDVCAIVQPEVIETVLIPSFLALCQDSEWMIRKSCAESFTPVSCVVSSETRKNSLAPAFANLLKDKMQCVRVAAFLSLGPFIITFAEPSIVSLGYCQFGDLVLKYKDGYEFNLNSAKSKHPLLIQDQTVEDHIKNLEMVFSSVGFLDISLGMVDSDVCSFNTFWLDGYNNAQGSTGPLKSGLGYKDPENELYNQFQYWRDPLPNIDNDLGNESIDNNNPSSPSCLDFQISHSPQSNLCSSITRKLRSLDYHEVEKSQKESEKENGDQEIVPSDLLHHFVSMSSEPYRVIYNTAKHCAYNLPAVALTLGPKNWDLIKAACKHLATDTQWKVRKIIASSLHELAELIGEELTTRDLVPIFKDFINDVDEVRIGALRHLAQFLKLLRPAVRNTLLPRLVYFQKTDYKRYWRFRQELAEQLLQILGLFSPADTCHHLSPIVQSLLLDRVAEVRKVSLHLVTELVSHVSIDVNLLRSLLAELAQQFAHSPRWNRRQIFALFCSRLISESVLSGDMFARDVLPHLLDLSWDRVPNVRLTVARTLANDIIPQPYFSDCSNPHHEILLSTLKRLQSDKDRDVKFFACQAVISPQTDPTV
ncbi:serine/threonine-protein phosphatase 4 regulatory subunit 1-like isoform X2 [Cimex lectularius]|uniref:Serine/threonine-protein phosphatase 4 regulatory subunit 1 n=1 Tax=Cimex lectularius TaxID=79782 RepID=A0A8I6SAZ0_CIMLE|nr:serine/threonine-protein phosphatase 4 regulatory subunit 1-like isoform X2 [Cimex lectularius]